MDRLDRLDRTDEFHGNSLENHHLCHIRENSISKKIFLRKPKEPFEGRQMSPMASEATAIQRSLYMYQPFSLGS